MKRIREATGEAIITGIIFASLDPSGVLTDENVQDTGDRKVTIPPPLLFRE